jgi:hypothetical protein
MKIGIIVEGDSEHACLPTLLGRSSTDCQILKVLRAKVDPLAPPAVIARGIKPELSILASKGAHCVVTVLDYERGTDCVPDRARKIQNAILDAHVASGVAQFEVVLKNSKFENWLVADTDAIRRMPARFRLTPGQISSIDKRADDIDALAILKAAAQGSTYGKVRDSIQITRFAQPHKVAANSRSFRRMLRVIGCHEYALQSRLAAP